ncbi:UNVERIFIED_CONTAM: Premnaspirodiene oxygenase [Sesamum indicum]
MDSGFPWNFTILALLVPVIFLLLLKKRKNSKPSSAKLPPGPQELPIIGHLHLISSVPFRSFRDLAKKYGPIMHLKFGEVPGIIISSPEIAKKVLKEQDPVFANRPPAIAMQIMGYNYKDIGFSPYGDYWRQMRKICIMELLSSKSVRSFGSIRNDEVSSLVKFIQASAGKPVNLTDKIFWMMNSITCRASFGTVCKDNDALIKLLRDGMQMAGGFEIADVFPSSKIVSALSWTKWRLVMMGRKLDMILDDIINEHKVNLDKLARESGDGQGKLDLSAGRRGNGEFGNEDLVDVFLRLKESGDLEFPIGNDNIKAILFVSTLQSSDVFSAATETSATAIDWIMTELMRNPGVMAKAQAEVRQVFNGSRTTSINEDNVRKLNYLKLVIRETLRLHPSVPFLPRASREECTINGYTIPANVKVLVNSWGMQRDPKYWTNPESFEPERFENNSMDFVGGDFEYLPFGSGRRMCPGITFALASIELPLAQLLYNFNWKLPEGVKPENLDMIENPGLTASRKSKLYVVPTPYNEPSDSSLPTLTLTDLQTFGSSRVSTSL